MTTVGSAVFLGLAGLAGGVIGTAGGITSLVTYPALLAVGINPFAANVTNAVSLIGSGVASTLASGVELRGQREHLRAFAAIAAIGGVTGALLLLVTPPDVFAWIVPVLIALAAALLLVQPRIVAWRASRAHVANPLVIRAAIFGVCIYSGYFGAGAGVLILAVALVLMDTDIVRANALKNAVLTVADLLPGVVFAIAGPVAWWAAIPLAVGASAGGALGPVVTRRTPPHVLRTVVALMGFGLAIWLTGNAIT